MRNILVTGGSGLVGGWLKHSLPDATYLSSSDFDLTSEDAVRRMFHIHHPDTIIHLAARVGGILDNIEHPCDYFEENVLMNTQLIKQARKNGVERFVGVLSTCIYPDVVDTYPLKETDLHLSEPTKTNFSYGYAKRAMAVQIDACNEQYGTKYNYLIPCNLYGDGDKDDPQKSHFVTALITKIHTALENGDDSIVLYGDGSPLRQFLHAEDFAKVIHKVVTNDICDSFNVATEEVYSIKEMAEIALKACGAEHLKIEFDSSKPNGQYRKDVCISKLKQNIPDFKPRTLFEGIQQTYATLK